MRITFVISAERTTTVMRHLDLDQRRLIISCPWDQSPAATLDALHDLLTERERVELEAALVPDAKTPPNP